MSYILSKDQTRLYYTVNRTSVDRKERPSVGALIVHGFGDHSQRYDQFTAHLNSLGVDVFRFDYRGHGRSEGKRGHILSFDEYLEDLNSAVNAFDEEFTSCKKLLLAHSNGALIATHALALNPKLSSWDGAVLSSPFYAIKVDVPWWKRFLGAKLSAIIPTLQIPTDLEPTHMSHDPQVINLYGSDPLIGRVASTRWLTETLQAHQAVGDRLKEIKIPVLFQLAGDDKVADSDYTEQLVGKQSHLKLEMKRYPELYHEIWFEAPSLNRKVFADLDQFVHTLSEKVSRGSG